MEQRRRRRTTDPNEAARCLATGLAEVAEFAETVGDPDPRRMFNHIDRLEHQLGTMRAIVRDYKTVVENYQQWPGEPLEFDVWGEDQTEQQRAEDPVGS